MKEKELIEKLITFLKDHILECEPGMRCGRCDELRNHISALEAEIKTGQCHNIYEKVKEVWKPEVKEQPIECFKKICIKSESDLPKELDNYFVCKKDGTFVIQWFNHGLTQDYWMKDIDWYLLSVQLPTDEEIFEYAFSEFPSHKDIPGTITDGCFAEGAKAMRDGTIEKWLKK